MLNTDLHNPNMDDAKRMTLEQFIRNNRGINEGEDLPTEFLEELYYEIKNLEIQVKKDCDGIEDFDGLLVERANVSVPFFTAHNSIHAAGVHERDMFVAISNATTRAMATVFAQSWDDALVMKALNGLKSSAHICAYFGLTQELDEIIDLLLAWGQDYITSIHRILTDANSTKLLTTNNIQNIDLQSESHKGTILDATQLEADLIALDLPLLPASFISSLNSGVSLDHNSPPSLTDVAGSAAHRGILSLHCALLLCKKHLSIVNESLPSLLEVAFALRDVNALPPRLGDLDDFADSKGNSLPPSIFATKSSAKVNAYKKSLSESKSSDAAPSSGLFSFLGFGHISSQELTQSHSNTNPLIKVLQVVSNEASLDQIIMKMNDVNMAKRILASMLGTMFPDDVSDESLMELYSDPLYEENAVFVLELAARLLVSNRGHSAELLPLFVSKFESLFSTRKYNDREETIGLSFPYLLERIIVTILRAAIHLYDIPDRGIRNHLVHLIELVCRLPYSYTKEISSRLGCGAAIVLRGCFLLFDSADEWAGIKNILDIAAQHQSGRPFVFDGISSLIEFAYPDFVDGEPASSNNAELSQDGAEAIRYLLLKFLEGSYENDLTYKLPSIMYIKRVCSRQNSSSNMLSSDTVATPGNACEQGTEWAKMISVIYNDVCLSEDEKSSKKGFESLHEVILSSNMDLIPHDQRLTLIQMACTNPPSIRHPSRIDSIIFIGRLFLTLMPELSNQTENWAQLEDFTIEVAKMIKVSHFLSYSLSLKYLISNFYGSGKPSIWAINTSLRNDCSYRDKHDQCDVDGKLQ